jgi:hypothetical protein
MLFMPNTMLLLNDALTAMHTHHYLLSRPVSGITCKQEQPAQTLQPTSRSVARFISLKCNIVVDSMHRVHELYLQCQRYCSARVCARAHVEPLSPSGHVRIVLTMFAAVKTLYHMLCSQQLVLINYTIYMHMLDNRWHHLGEGYLHGHTERVY